MRTAAILTFGFCLVGLVSSGLDLPRSLYAAQRSQTEEAEASRGQAQNPANSTSSPRTGQSINQSLSDLADRALKEGSVRVIVGLRVGTEHESRLSITAIAAQRSRIAEAQTALIARLSPQSVTTIKRFSFIPFVALEVDATGLAQLSDAPEKTTIEEDAMLQTSLAESVPLIGAPSAWASGYSGNGQTVAILDSGVDKSHVFLTNKVISEACYSTTGSQTTSVCPGGVSQSTASGSGVNCSVGGCDHGTHVAGIAAGTSGSFSGVAKDANIIAIQVFSRVNGCGGSNCISAFSSDIILGMQRVQQLSGSMNIAAINLSLGGSGYGTNCDSSQTAFKAAVDSLRAAGIATVIASGNSYSNGGVSFPACVSTSISVGSSGDGSNGVTVDAISSFSNSASFLNLLAPGEWITSSVPNGGFAIFRGTSMAAPHVAGAWAVLKSKTPGASVSQVLQALTNTGVPITDSRNGVTKPRIQVDTAVAALQGSVCNYAVSPTTQAIGQPGGGGSLNVIADAGCEWTASSNVPWLNMTSGSSGIGNGSVSYTVAANLSVERDGTLLVGGRTFTVSQAGVPVFGVDDGSFENATGLQSGGSSYRVNRVTPSNYPATINAVAIYFPGYTGVMPGNALNVIAAVNPSGSSTIDGIQFSSTPAIVQVLDQFNVYSIPALTINSGDFVIGMQMSHAAGVLPFALDTNLPSQGRSYRSTNGTTFVVIDTIGTPGNYGIRGMPAQTVTCPVISDIDPRSGIVGSDVIINGSSFAGVTTVKFSNSASASFTINGDGQITATVPPGAVTGPILLSKVGCADVQTGPFIVITCPTVSGITPSGIVGSNVMITGDNLTGVNAVTFSNGVAASFTINNGSQITATVPAGAVTGPITLSKTPCLDVQTASFTVITCPTVGGIAPTSGIVGSSVIISGINFTGVTAVRFSNNVVASFTVDSASQITATVPAGAVTGSITISRIGCADVQTGSFAIIACPTVSGIGPTTGLIGSSVMITGANVTGVTAVRFSNNVSASFNIDNSSQITATVPIGGVTGPVTLSKNGCSDVQTASFTVIPCPAITGASPGSGLVGSSVIITGSSFTGVTAVKFSNNVSASFIIDNNSQITANVPLNAVTGPITVSRTGCSDVQTLSFTVIPCPTVGGVSPGSGIVGSSVTITGTSLTGVTAIKFSNNVSASFSIDNSTQITVTVPIGAVTGAITISRPGCSDVQTGSFTVIICPTVSGTSPGSGVVGSNVVISGGNFSGISAVKFTNNVVASFTINNGSQITATVPSGAMTGPISISRPGCPDVQTGSFTVITCPTVILASPSSGIVGSSVTIFGSNFTGLTAVRFSNNVSASFTINNDAQLTATVPAGAISGPMTLAKTGCSDVQTTSFTVIACPSVGGISPGAGIVGSSVVMSGTNFIGVTTVRFSNNVSASFTIDSTSQITVTVPAGAVSGPITIGKTGCTDVQTGSFTVNAPCSYTISPASRYFPAKVGTGTVDVLTGAGCAWSVSHSIPWVTITADDSGVGNGTVSFSVAANSGVVRTGVATVAGQALTINQGANFLDVAQDDIFYEFIGKLSAARITAGCDASGTLFCPGSTVTREQMSAFIIRASGTFNPPHPSTQRFVDVPPTNVFYAFVEQMAVSGITLGCNAQGPLYCPTSGVTREQMSAFIIRALGEFVPPTPASQRFLDVPPSNPFYAFVDQMAIRGITVGCDANGPLYCPGGTVTRGQMAVFLVRAFGL